MIKKEFFKKVFDSSEDGKLEYMGRALDFATFVELVESGDADFSELFEELEEYEELEEF